MGIFYTIISFLLSVIFTFSTWLGLYPQTIPAKVTLDAIEQEAIMYQDDRFAFAYEKGSFSLSLKGVTMFLNAVSEYKQGDSMVSSLDYEEYRLERESICDKRGNGTRLAVTADRSGLPTMKQIFTFYEGERYFTVSVELSSQQSVVASNYIAPLVVRDGKLQNGNPKWTNFLEVPFDNDSWATFETRNLCQSGLSHEVGAFFTPDAGQGLILGSLTHDTWKSAVAYTNRLACVEELSVYSGANTALTRDQSPHGTVSGEKISSAVFFVGFYDNWKDGMTEFARTNTTFAPKRESVTDSNPIGWNSWGAVQSDISYENAVGASDYIKNNFQDMWQGDGEVVYINLDSFWDNLSDEELKAFVEHCEANGQQAGIYSSPFVLWWDEEGMKNNCVPGTDIPYNDIRLKKADGSYYGNDIDGCYPLDVTNPATILHFRTQLERLMNCGFTYIKLDFLVHGALEGDFYNEDIQTGMQAYNYAMNEIDNILGDDVFINLSMAPIFPYSYANGRRLCCDTYYGIGETEYMLNSLTYGFWESELYDWIDPDHIVLWGKDGNASAGEARCRMISGVVTGGSFLAGDDFVSPASDSAAAFARYAELLGNEKLIDVLKIGRPFQAKISADCEYAAEIFTLEQDGKLYIAVLNYRIVPKLYTVDLPFEHCSVENLLSGKTEKVSNGKIRVSVGAKDALLFEVTSGS